jgi:hypothetical protein
MAVAEFVNVTKAKPVTIKINVYQKRLAPILALLPVLFVVRSAVKIAVPAVMGTCVKKAPVWMTPIVLQLVTVVVILRMVVVILANVAVAKCATAAINV